MSPVVMLIDDLDRTFGAGSAGGGGVGLRVLGTLLTWMQERGAGVLLVATMGDPRGAAQELIRAGRFDLNFFLDLPAAADRARLIEHFLRRYGRETDCYDYRSLAAQTAYQSQADFAGGVEESLFVAARGGRANPTQLELEAALTGVPLTVGRVDERNMLRFAWAGVAVPAALPASGRSAEE